LWQIGLIWKNSSPQSQNRVLLRLQLGAFNLCRLLIQTGFVLYSPQFSVSGRGCCANTLGQQTSKLRAL
jgi:hypothetical protein